MIRTSTRRRGVRFDPRSLEALSLFALAVLLLSASAGNAAAQGLNWEGQTGAFITPFALHEQFVEAAGKLPLPRRRQCHRRTHSVIRDGRDS